MKLSEKHLRHIIRNIILNEGTGQKPGKLELVKIDFNKVKEFFKNENFDYKKEIPNFEIHFKLAQKLANLGKTKRKDMPVITNADVKKFQSKLAKGEVDIFAPFADETPKNNPFPEGLSGIKAKQWLEAGLRDGQKNDDKVDVNIKKKTVGNLKPIQQQIYFDKSMGKETTNDIKKSEDFFSNKSFFITSSDDFIIDGHHRWLSALLLNPKMKVNTLSINLPINKLLPMSIAFGDAIGNKRNL